MDIEHARYNMVEQQIRPWEVLDQDVLDLLLKVKREEFVPGAYRSLAFVDMEIPLGHGEQMWSPKLEARALQELQLKKLTRCWKWAPAAAISPPCSPRLRPMCVAWIAWRNLSPKPEGNWLLMALATSAWKQGTAPSAGQHKGPYDAIIMTGSLPLLPDALPRQLAPGGRLFVILGEGPIMQATLMTCIAPGSYRRTVLFETLVKSLQHAPQPERFVF